jgi:hypothetical protein
MRLHHMAAQDRTMLSGAQQKMSKNRYPQAERLWGCSHRSCTQPEVCDSQQRAAQGASPLGLKEPTL